MSDQIAIRGLEVDCIVGVYEHERHTEQPLRLDMQLSLDLRSAGRTGRINETIDYATIGHELRALLKFRRYQLLEAAAEEIAAMILGVNERVEEVALSLVKPRALADLGAQAEVSISRTRDDYPRRHEDTGFGSVEILLETRDAGLYLLHVDPEHSIPPHHHQVMQELEWLIDGELWWNELRVRPRTPVQWEKGRVHGYRNRSTRRATVFCCDMPPFIREDEIEVRR